MSAEKKDKKKILSAIICLCVGAVIGVLSVKLPTWVHFKNQAEKQIDVSDYKADDIVQLGKYKGIAVSLTPSEEDIQSEIDSFLQEYAVYEQKKGTAEDGDMVYAKVSPKVDGKKIEVAEEEDYFELGSNMYLSGIEDTLIGMKTGQTKKVKIKVPKGYYGNDSIDGKEAEYQIDLEYICGETILPEYTDDFVKSTTEYSTVEEHTKALAENLMEENDTDKKEMAWNQVLEASKVSEKDYPESLLEQQREEILQGYYDMAVLNGSTRDEVFQQFGCKDEKEFVDTQLEEAARDGAKDILVSEAIAIKENITYTDKEYEKFRDQDYEENRDLYKSKENYEKKNEAYLKHTVLMEKVKSFIDKHAQYK